MKSAFKIALATAAVMLAQPALANHDAKHKHDAYKAEDATKNGKENAMKNGQEVRERANRHSHSADERTSRRVDSSDRRIERRTRGRDYASEQRNRGTFWGYGVQSYDTPEEMSQAKRTVKQH